MAASDHDECDLTMAAARAFMASFQNVQAASISRRNLLREKGALSKHLFECKGKIAVMQEECDLLEATRRSAIEDRDTA